MIRFEPEERDIIRDVLRQVPEHVELSEKEQRVYEWFLGELKKE